MINLSRVFFNVFYSDQFRNISNCMSIGTKIDLMSNGLKEKAQNEGWWDSKTTFNWTEGSLISESFSLWLKFPKKGAKSLS